MMRRLLVVCLLASVFVMAPSGEASACSCAPLQPAEALAEYDAAFVGKLVQRPASDGSFQEQAPYVFEVETWVKGDLGREIIVFAPNQGSACGFEAALGQRIGVFVMVEGERARGGLCTTVDADLLLAGDQPYAIDGSGPPVFLVAGNDGAARLMLLDAAGGLMRAIGTEGESLHGLAMCPGSSALVELMNDQLIVRSTDDLAEVRRVDLDGLPYRVGVQAWCRDEAGDEIWLSIEEWSEEAGVSFQLVDAEALDVPLVEGGYGWVEVGAEYAIAGEGPTGERIWRIDLATSEVSLLHEIPMADGDSPPSGRGWIDPSGELAMITQGRWNDDTGPSASLFLYDLTTAELLWESEVLASGDGVGWVDDTRFLVITVPDMDSGEAEYLLAETDRRESDDEYPVVIPLDDVPGWKTLRVGDDLAGVSGAKLQTMPISGGDPVVMRLLPSESHRLAAVLDSEAVAIPVPVVEPVTDNLPGSAEPAAPNPGGAGSSESSIPWPWLGGAAALLTLGLLLFRRRRDAADEPVV